MSDVTKEISVLIRLRGGAAFASEAGSVSRSIRGIGKAADETKLEALGAKFGKMSSTLMGFGRALTPLSLGIAAVGYESSKAATTFQKNMTLLVTQANFPRKHIQALTKDIMSLSTAVGQTPTDLAAAAYWPASGGRAQQAQIRSILKYASMGAAIGGDTASENAKAMSQIMSSGFYSKNPKALIALMDTAIGQGHMQMGDLMEATSTGIVPMLKMTGMKGNAALQQLYAALASEASGGVSPTQASSRLRLTLTSMMSPTGSATSGAQYQLGRIGLGRHALANDLARGGLLQAVQDLQTHGAEHGYGRNQFNDLIASVFSRSRGFASIASVMKQMPRIEQILGIEQNGNNKRFDTHFREATHTTAFKQGQVRASFQKAMIALGKEVNKDLIPVLTQLTKDLNSVTRWFSKLSPSTKEAIIKFLALVAILAPVLVVLSALSSGFRLLLMMLRPVVWVLRILWVVFDALSIGLGVVLGVSTALAGAILLAVAAVAILAYVFRHQLWDAAKFLAKVFVDVIKIALWPVIEQVKLGIAIFKELWSIVKKVIGVLGHLAGGAVHALMHPGATVSHFLGGLIPHLANGGTLTSGGMVMVGEVGPELLSLPRGATVTPLQGNGLASLRADMSGAGEGGTLNLTTNVNLDGKVLASAVSKVYRNQNNRK